ncbi:MAG: S-layer homology domain-containing protein, partial [Peptostreptococcaceae bacterium]
MKNKISNKVIATIGCLVVASGVLMTGNDLVSLSSLGTEMKMSNKGSFPDVATSHWAYDYITDYAQRGILDGYQDGTFKPNQNITRAEFMKVMVQTFEITNFGERYLKDNANHLNPSNMTDTWGHWANVDIRNGASHGIY